MMDFPATSTNQANTMMMNNMMLNMMPNQQHAQGGGYPSTFSFPQDNSNSNNNDYCPVDPFDDPLPLTTSTPSNSNSTNMNMMMNNMNQQQGLPMAHTPTNHNNSHRVDYFNNTPFPAVPPVPSAIYPSEDDLTPLSLSSSSSTPLIMLPTASTSSETTSDATAAATNNSNNNSSSKKRKRKGAATAEQEDPDKPKRPLNAYNIFFRHKRAALLNALPVRAAGKPRNSHGKLGFEDMAKTIGAAWKALTDEERKEFDDMAAAEKQAYKEAMAVYNQQAKEKHQVKLQFHHRQQHQAGSKHQKLPSMMMAAHQGGSWQQPIVPMFANSNNSPVMQHHLEPAPPAAAPTNMASLAQRLGADSTDLFIRMFGPSN